METSRPSWTLVSRDLLGAKHHVDFEIADDMAPLPGVKHVGDIEVADHIEVVEASQVLQASRAPVVLGVKTGHVEEARTRTGAYVPGDSEAG